VESQLSNRLADYGVSLTPTVERLAAFSSVQNTYLTIFQMLGGLGLVVGSIGLALVVLRNVLDRRGELAMLRAVGFPKNTLSRMLRYEHWALLLAALVIGVFAALVAVMPALRAPGADVPGLSLALTVVAIAVSGMIWVALATHIALGGQMLDALRNE
ncbi:MAG TPA: ABC transporter permease, partial [Phycisphaerales bacterium]|nr:ABC transporter permease [Phycisphaerales bacterium]